MKLKTIVFSTLTSLLVSSANVEAKDVSGELTAGYVNSTILSCIIRLEIYAAQSQNLIENPDKDFQRKSNEFALKFSMPYRDNVVQAAWNLAPFDDWDAFYQMQYEQVRLHFETNNVFFDTLTCVRGLLAYGVMYPEITDPENTPPEQQKIFLEYMQRMMNEQ